MSKRTNKMGILKSKQQKQKTKIFKQKTSEIKNKLSVLSEEEKRNMGYIRNETNPKGNTSERYWNGKN